MTLTNEKTSRKTEKDAHGIRKRSVTIAGHRTSLSLEDPFWEALQEIARQRGVSIAKIIREVDAERSVGNLSSAIRIKILGHFRSDMKQAAE
ncbi:ribbon-helix-helix domain-containing protein [Coralliovum pocilloporae]|uniref:ribbon-helix-helix domain-containing protein n=1 Tax=Coralliovum pocilloporae TaxID=3066369 RepID=UPI003306CCE8